MERTISATEARIHFGEVLRSVVERGDAVIVERSGQPQVVLLSVAEYERLLAAKERRRDWRDLVRESHEIVQREIGDGELPDVDRVFDEMREERDAEILGSLR